MSSPSRNIDSEKDSTMFGQLMNIQKQTGNLNTHLSEELKQIQKLQTEFIAIQNEAKVSLEQSKNKLNEQTKQFQQKIKNYLIAQKAEYMRFANQINQMIQNSKQINAQLILLGSKFEEFQKNVGL